MSDPIFVLLKEGVGWVQEKYMWDVLGGIVKNPLSPTDNSIPGNTRRYSKGLNEVILDHFVLDKEELKKEEKSLLLPGFLKIRGKREDVKALRLQGKRIVVKRLRNQEFFWESMMSAAPGIIDKVLKWKSEEKTIWGTPKGKVYWVTGVLLCQNVHIAASSSEAYKLIERGEIPIGTCADIAASAAIACPLPMALSALPNVVGERSKLTASSECFAGKAEDTYIFGLQLREVVSIGKKAAQELTTTPATMKLSKIRQLNDSEEGDGASLETIEPDDGTWASILEEEEVPLDQIDLPGASDDMLGSSEASASVKNLRDTSE